MEKDAKKMGEENRTISEEKIEGEMKREEKGGEESGVMGPGDNGGETDERGDR